MLKWSFSVFDQIFQLPKVRFETERREIIQCTKPYIKMIEIKKKPWFCHICINTFLHLQLDVEAGGEYRRSTADRRVQVPLVRTTSRAPQRIG